MPHLEQLHEPRILCLKCDERSAICSLLWKWDNAPWWRGGFFARCSHALHARRCWREAIWPQFFHVLQFPEV